MPDSVAVSILRGGTSRGVFFRDEDLPAEPAERRGTILNVFGAGGGGLVDGLGGENPVLRKVAIVGRGEDRGGLPVLDYTFGQVNSDLSQVDHTLECGNISSAVPLFGALSGWCPAPTRGSEVLINLVNTRRSIRAEWLGGGLCGGTLRLWLQNPAAAGREGALLLAEPTSRLDSGPWGSVRCTVLRAFNTHLFVDGRDLALPDPVAPERLSGEALGGLADLVRQILEKIGEPGPLKVSIVAASAEGALKARTVFPLEGRDHPSVAVTGAAALAVAACIPGSVVSDAVGGDPGAELDITHLGGRLTMALRRGPDGLPTEAGLERSCRLVLRGHASLVFPGEVAPS